jgi:hypothetical protein
MQDYSSFVNGRIGEGFRRTHLSHVNTMKYKGYTKAGVGKLWPLSQIYLLPVFVNKVLMKQPHPSITDCPWLLSSALTMR